MSGEEQKPSGPDLAVGIAFADLADGAMLAGHARGEAVLLARRGDEIFAVAAQCTHYGAPLVEGLIDGETVRCPWHHACFSLRTGTALKAPALTDLARYALIREPDPSLPGGTRVRVGDRLPAAARRSRPAGVGEPGTIVIAGAGAAGNAAAETLRREGFDGRVILIGREESVPYDRPNLSKDYLAGKAPEEWIPLRSPEFYAEQRIELKLGKEIAELDTAGRRVSIAGGEELAYDRLLLALGADPVRLPTPGGERIHVLRSLADSRAIVARVDPSIPNAARRAVVIGASFIGLEVAAALRMRGVEVTVVAPEPLPLAKILGPELGAFIRDLHAERGVDFRLGLTVESVGPSDVVLADGARVAADLVVSGVGVRPVVALAERAGLALDRGIVVDARLETSVPGVFAAGDLARYPFHVTGESIRVEHWVHAERQGQAAARNMLGAGEAFRDVPFFWSHHYEDVAINYVGHAEKWERIDVDGSFAERNVAVSYWNRGVRVALATIFRDRESLEAELALERL